MAESEKPRFDETTLTIGDEKALDEAWKSITDADVEASIRWLESLPPHEKERKSHGR